MCDDITSTIASLENAGIECAPVRDRGWGLVTTIGLPGGEHIGLYEPRHPSPLLPLA